MQKSIKKNFFPLTAIVLLCLGIAVCAVGFLASATEQDGGKAVAPTDLWNAPSGIRMTANCDLPEYFYNGKELSTGDTVHTKDDGYWQPYELNGIKVSATTTVRSLEFKNVIDVSSYTQNDHLFDFTPIATSRHVSAGFETLFVTLQDYDDPTNWLKIEFYAGSTQFSVKSYVRVHTSTGYSGGYRWGALGQDARAVGFESAIAGFYNSVAIAQWEDYCAMQFSLRYDSENNMICLGSPYKKSKPSCVLKLDDTAAVGSGNEWRGFTKGRLKLSVTVDGINSDSATYFITQVANTYLCGNEVNDSAEPFAVIEEPDGDVSTTVMGYPYKLFACEFDDVVDGRLDYEVRLTTILGSVVRVENIGKDSFIPTVVGINTVEYRATDASGNVCSKKYNLNVVPEDSIEKPHIDYAGSIREGKAGEEITVSTPSYGGGVGALALRTKIIRLSDGEEFEITDGSFVPYVAGKYALVFSVTDYIGMKASETVYFDVAGSDLPILNSELIIYKKFVSGVSVDLPKPDAYDYHSYRGQRVRPVITVKAIGTGDKSGYSEKIDNYVFTPTIEKFGTAVTIVYEIASVKNPDKNIRQSFEVPIVKAEYMWDYFAVGKDVSIGYNPNVTNESFVDFKYNDVNDTSIEFMYPLYVGDLSLQFTVPEITDETDAVKIEFRAFEYSNRKIELTVSQYSDDLCEVACNGKIGYIEGQLGNVNSMLGIAIEDGVLYDAVTGKVLFFEPDFEKFENGRVWVKIDYVNVRQNGHFYIKKINNHIFRATYLSTGLRKFNDAISPVVVLDSGCVWDAELGATVNIPYAKGHDEFSSHTTVSVSVQAPDGRMLLEDVSVTENLSFQADMYGEYTITYTCVDAAGNLGNKVYSVYVRDTAKPILFVSGNNTINCTVGETKEFAAVRAIDNVDGVVDVTVYIITPDGRFVNITKERKYTFKNAGKYVLRYCASDSNNNIAISDVAISVNG